MTVKPIVKPKSSLRHAISHSVLEHTRFLELKNLLCEYVQDSFEDLPPKIVAVMGPSRVGKSELIANVMKHYPPQTVNGVKKIDVLVVKVPSPVNPLTLPHCVLTALGLNTKRGADNTDLMAKQLALAQTKTIIFEEASHVVEVNARVIPRAAGDFFKSLFEYLRLTVILVGVPHLTRLFDSNEQLLWRADSPLEFLPYSTSDDDLNSFDDAVAINISHFTSAGVTFGLTPEELADNLYLCSGGLYGIVHKFFIELARVVDTKGLSHITESDCLAIAKTIGSAGHPRLMPFSGLPIPSTAMAAAHTAVLSRSGLSPSPVPVI